MDASLTEIIEVTPAAKEHFYQLLKEEEGEVNLRIAVINPGSPMAEVAITYCPSGEENKDDLVQILQVNDDKSTAYKLFIENSSNLYLVEASIDFTNSDLGGQISVKAPNIGGKEPDPNSPLFERIDFVIQAEINPNLASHGGMVTLVDISDKGEVFLRFGGGCHGCGMVSVTLKNGIEKTLIDKFPEVTKVSDITNHEDGENPYC